MEKPKPIKRDKNLQPLSHDHHDALLLCWKIRQGLKKEIDPERIMEYGRAFFQNKIAIHFTEEEELLFPLLGMDHPMVVRACKEHRKLRKLFHSETNEQNCQSIANELQAHVRFEERKLFNEIQEKAGREELQEINRQLHPRTADGKDGFEWHDPFWQSGPKAD